MSSYYEFAEFYDCFMEDVDYIAWCRYIEDIFEVYGVKPVRVLDTACGTGNITIPMAEAGYEMWGLDLSLDMLSVAESKARASKRRIRFLNQDMTKMSLKEKYQAVLCMCDGVNYIHDEEGLFAYFESVFECLDKKGIFIFDISSYNKLRRILSNNTFYEEKNNKHYIWNNSYDEESDTVVMDLIFFVPQGSLYRKFEEQHIQKAHKTEFLEGVLRRAGFEEIKIFGDFTFERPNEESERIFFAAIKK